MTVVAESFKVEDLVDGMVSFGRSGYGGPCQPNGEHRYFFKLYALDRNLKLRKNEARQIAESAMEGHIIDQAEIMGLHQKS